MPNYIYNWSGYNKPIPDIDDSAEVVVNILADVIDDLQKENKELKSKIVDLRVRINERDKMINTLNESKPKTYKSEYDAMCSIANKTIVELDAKKKELKAKEATITDMANKLVDASAQVNYWQLQTKHAETKLTKIMDVLQGKKIAS